jgi:hypothetical protein
MSALLITYDLNSPGRKYDALHDEIKALGAWWHYMESTWIVVTARNGCWTNKRVQRMWMVIRPFEI